MLRHRWKISIGIALVFVLLMGIELAMIGNGPKKRVEAYKKFLIAKGEKLEISELLPPPVPPEQNGADLVNQALGMLKREDYEEANIIPAMRIIGSGKAIICFEQPEVRDWQYTNSWANEMAVVADDRPMNELLRQAMNYPAIDFHLDFDDWRGFARYIRPLGFSARRLSAEAMCNLHQGDAVSAATNICTILGLVNGERETHVALLAIRVNLSLVAANASWESLQSSGVNDQELALLQNSWEHIEYIHSLEKELEMERDFYESEILKMRTSDDYFHESTRVYYRKVDWSGGFGEGFKDLLSNAKLTCARSMYRASWTYSDELRMLQNYQLALETVLAAATNGFFNPAYSNMIEKFNDNVTDEPDDWLTKLDDPHLHDTFSERSGDPILINLTLEAEATRRMTITAIALKRYRLKHKKYPSSLAELVPQFILSVPRDPIDGKPLRYRLTQDSSFLLYSIGLNGKDDGGDGSLTIRTWLDTPLRFASPDALDWVWPQPATPAEIQAFYAHPPGP